jgi:hypothetical protein
MGRWSGPLQGRRARDRRSEQGLPWQDSRLGARIARSPSRAGVRSFRTVPVGVLRPGAGDPPTELREQAGANTCPRLEMISFAA